MIAYALRTACDQVCDEENPQINRLTVAVRLVQSAVNKMAFIASHKIT